MNEVVTFLQENPVHGKLWFCTNSTKDVYKDMQPIQILKFPFPAPPTPGFV